MREYRSPTVGGGVCSPPSRTFIGKSLGFRTKDQALIQEVDVMPVVKVIEVLGISEKSWEDAATQALKGATNTIRNITGLDLVSQTAKVKDGKITEYHATCKVAFRVD